MNKSHAIVAMSHGIEATADTFSALCRINAKGVKKILYTDVKFDGQKKVGIRNVEASYPADLVRLHNTALVAVDCEEVEQYFQAGFALFCLDQAVKNEKAARLIVVCREPVFLDITAVIANLKHSEVVGISDLPEHTSDCEYILFDRREDRVQQAVTMAADLYCSGAMHATATASMASLLRKTYEMIT